MGRGGDDDPRSAVLDQIGHFACCQARADGREIEPRIPGAPRHRVVHDLVVDHHGEMIARSEPEPPQQPGEPAGKTVELDIRSEEHTSALQSLMRISYAVFCLKTKTH